MSASCHPVQSRLAHSNLSANLQRIPHVGRLEMGPAISRALIASFTAFDNHTRRHSTVLVIPLM